jgi:2,3-bisphosphoglycerate-dependent phosphoglycerate mutase
MDMPTRVWLMRHAETDRPHIFHGFESDTDLSEYGYRQAHAVAPVIASYTPDVIVSSGMLRARKTAEPIAQACNLPLHIEPHLHERKVGDLVGTTANNELGIWPETLNRWIAGETSYAPLGSESFDDMKNRVMPVWDRLTRHYEEKSLVIVAHGIVCRVILFSLLDTVKLADWPKMGRIQNVSISELHRTNGKWHANRIAEVPDVVQLLQRSSGV